jgi:hypothetical protein
LLLDTWGVVGAPCGPKPLRTSLTRLAPPTPWNRGRSPYSWTAIRARRTGCRPGFSEFWYFYFCWRSSLASVSRPSMGFGASRASPPAQLVSCPNRTSRCAQSALRLSQGSRPRFPDSAAPPRRRFRRPSLDWNAPLPLHEINDLLQAVASALPILKM